MLSTQPWTPIELTFSSASDYENPFAEIDVDVDFYGPSGARIRRPAFWDGGRTWRVRFAPPTEGDWAYRTTATNRDPGLHERTGSVRSTAALEATGIRAHGFLKASASGTHLAHRDNTPFFWLGDTHWRFAWESWDESNKPGWNSQFRDTVDLRVEQGFTVYQSNIMSWSPPPFWDTLVLHGALDVTYFRDVIDPRFAYIARRGLVHALGLAWYSAIDRGVQPMIRLARYIVARYGAYPMVWTLAGEVAGYDPELRAERLRGWTEVAEAICDSDDYHHPLTAHLTNERPLPADLQDHDWLTFALSQLGHGDLHMDASYWLNHRAAHPGKPLVEGESFYEGLTSVEPAGRRTVTDIMVRQVAYRAFQSGCCGYSYGAQGCWNGAWDENTSTSMWGNLAWADGVDLPAASQLGHLRRFYESVDWTELSPAPELFRANYWTNEIFNPTYTTATGDRTTVVTYFGETYRHDEGDAQIIGLPTVPFSIEWFNPKTGAVSRAADDVLPRQQMIDIPKPPSAGDWILTLRGTPKGND